MAYTNTTCGVVIDRPDADAIIADGGYGRLLDFPFRDHQAGETNPDLFGEHPEEEWDYTSGGNYYIEMLPELQAAAPKGNLHCSPMTLYGTDANRDETTDGRWAKHNQPGGANYSDLWRLTPVLSHPTTDYALFYDTRAYSSTLGYYGVIETRTDAPQLPAEPNFTLRAFRWGPPPNAATSGYNYIEVHVCGTPGVRGQWSLVLPRAATATAQYRYAPKLGWRQFPEDEWTIVREFKLGGSSKSGAGGKPVEQIVTWETVDRHFILTIDDDRFVYYVPDKYWGDTEPIIPQGPVRIIVYNHKAAVNLTEIEYPSGGYCQRADNYPIDSAVYNTGSISTYDIAWEPEGTTCTVSSNYQTGADAGTIKHYKPRVWFRQAGDAGDGTGVTDPYHRAVAYLAQVDFEPSLSSGVHLGVTAPPANTVIEANGTISNTWKKNTCTVKLAMDKADADTFVTDYALKGNNKFTVTPGLQSSIAGDTGKVHFTGYLTERPIVRRGVGEQSGRSIVECRLMDGVYRLESRYWPRLGNFTNWEIAKLFRRVLNECEIPDSMVYIWNRTASPAALQDYATWDATDDVTPTIDVLPMRGKLRFDFGPSTGVVHALNELANSVGWFWGVNTSGQYFIRPPVEYVPATGVLWTLDDGALATTRGPTTEAAATANFFATPQGKRFANSIWVTVDKGYELDEGWAMSTASHNQASAANFVGYELQEVHEFRDGQDAQEMAQRILEERAGRSINYSSRELMLRWSFEAVEGATGSPLTLMPDDFIDVEATGLGVATGTVFQNITKTWSVQGGPDLRYKATFEAKRVRTS